MKRITLILSVLLALVTSGANAVAAQSSDVDVDGIGETVLAVDAEVLVEALAATPDESVLPDGFENPASGTPEAQDLIDSFEIPTSTMAEAVGTVTHGLDTDASVVPGLISTGIITYITVEDEITGDDLADFEDGAREGVEEDPNPSNTAAVETIEVAGADAVNIEVVTEAEGIVAVVQIIAIPVGNTMVVATVVSADQGTVDEDAVLELASELAVAGVENLGIVAEGIA